MFILSANLRSALRWNSVVTALCREFDVAREAELSAKFGRGMVSPVARRGPQDGRFTDVQERLVNLLVPNGLGGFLWSWGQGKSLHRRGNRVHCLPVQST